MATPYTNFPSLVASLGTFQFGYHLSELNALQNAMICSQSTTANSSHKVIFDIFPQCLPINAFEWGLVQSIFTIGGLLGAFFSGQAAAKHGNIFMMRCLTVGFIVGGSFEALAPNLSILICGRWLSGISAGAATVVCSTFIVGLAPSDMRGQYGAFVQVTVNLGLFASQLLGNFLGHSSAWRASLATSAGVALITLVGLLLFPRDIIGGTAGDATLKAANVMPTKPTDTKHVETTFLLLESRSVIAPSPASIMDVLRIREYRQATIAVTAAMMAQQLTGINSIVMYSVSILEPTMPTAAKTVTVMLSAIHVSITLLTSSISDRIGRRVSLLISTLGMAISASLLALSLNHTLPCLSIVAITFSIISFNLGLGPVPFTLARELVQPEAISAVSSVALAANWGSAFCVAQFFPMINEKLSNGDVFWLFAGIGVVFVVFIGWWVPESKGKDSIDEVWGHH